MPKRIRRDHPNYELRHARVRVARKRYYCVWCNVSWHEDGELKMMAQSIPVGMTYARISETRLPVCGMHFDPDDIVETEK